MNHWANEKNAEVLLIAETHGQSAAAATQTAYHAARDFHLALAHVNERIGYDAGRLARIQRYGLSAAQGRHD